MKNLYKFTLFNLLSVFAGTALAHGGHGEGFAHSPISIEQFLIAFALILLVYPVSRLFKRK